MTEHNLLDHPAVRAWGQTSFIRALPKAIDVLKNRHGSQVYRLVGIGPSGSGVIAKRYPAARAYAERRVYEKVLPRLPIPVLRCYGLVEEEDSGSAWLFVEDAAGSQYDPQLEEHRVFVSEWLAALHLHGGRAAVELALPDRGPNYYLVGLRSARDQILRNLTNAALQEEDKGILRAVVSQCDLVEHHWAQVEELCQQAPRTLVHADLHASNLHFRSTPAGLTLLTFDWESAGYGPPVADLALPGLDLAAYQSIAGDWPSAVREGLEKLVMVGNIFRLIGLIDWESRGLGVAWLWKPIRRMSYYRAEMSQVLEAAKW